jgi:hypothetical protein
MFHLDAQLLIATTRALAGLGVAGEQFPGAATPINPDIGGALHEAERGSWDAQFIQRCGYWSHYDHRSRTSSWPIPAELTSTPELAQFGDAHGILRDAPRPGDIFLQWGPPEKAFVHSGVVAEVLASRQFRGKPPHFDLYTIEGDTDEFGRLKGGKAMRVRRGLSPAMGDRFLRWTDLECQGLRQVLHFAEYVETRRSAQ